MASHKWDFLFQPFKRKPFFVPLFHNEVFHLYHKKHNRKLKKEFRKDVSFPKLNTMALLFLGRNEGNRQVSSRSFYYYLLLYPFFVYLFYWRPSPSSHQSKS
jgi:hypothetical protein